MLTEYIKTGNSLMETGVTSNINQRVKYTSDVQTQILNTAGVRVQIFGSTNSLGVLIKSINIKAIQDVSDGMIRLYVQDTYGMSAFVDEIRIYSTDFNTSQKSLEIEYDLDYYLPNDSKLLAETENSESFIVTVYGLNQSY